MNEKKNNYFVLKKKTKLKILKEIKRKKNESSLNDNDLDYIRNGLYNSAIYLNINMF